MNFIRSKISLAFTVIRGKHFALFQESKTHSFLSDDSVFLGVNQEQKEKMGEYFMVANWTNLKYGMDAFTLVKSRDLDSNIYRYSS